MCRITFPKDQKTKYVIVSNKGTRGILMAFQVLISTAEMIELLVKTAESSPMKKTDVIDDKENEEILDKLNTDLKVSFQIIMQKMKYC